jgi:hypothetical protein
VAGEILGCQVLVALSKIPIAGDLPVAFLTDREDPELYAHFLAAGVSVVICTRQGLDAAISNEHFAIEPWRFGPQSNKPKSRLQ